MADRSVDFLLVGGGVASVGCAQQLRRSGADGTILIVGRETDAPYDRPPCSKGYLRGEQTREDVALRPAAWYEQRAIELLTRVSAMKLDPAARTVRLSNKQEVAFGSALVATGANVRRLNVPGSDLEGIHYLRTLGNADAIREDAAGKRVVLIGGSYLGTELAASLTAMGSTCTVLMLEPVVLSRGFGETAGRWFHSLLEQHGVAVRGGEDLERFEGADGRVTRVVTRSGATYEADAVVIGAGAVPDVMLARGAGLELGHTGGVRVDRFLRSSAPRVYGAGDMAEYESVLHGGAQMRIEHWDVAFSQGRTAARNMLGEEVAHDVVPYFFSDIGDWASLEYVGPAHRWDREVVRGAFDDGAFTVFYLEEGHLRAALSVGRSEDLAHARRIIAAGGELSGPVEALGDLSSDLAAL